MKILLAGYGAMGRVVEELALERGHEISGVFSLVDVPGCPYTIYNKIEDIPQSDVIIDFSHPSNTTCLLEGASTHKIPMVVATTGEREKIQALMDNAGEYIPVFFSANMSYGVHVFTELLKYVTPLLEGSFDIEIVERHHNKKIDAPSGTAVKLLEAIQSVTEGYFPVYDRSQVSKKRDPKEIGMSALRGGTIVGEHEILFAGTDETIQLIHRAQSKKIFADGALKVAEKLVEENPGFYNFTTL